MELVKRVLTAVVLIPIVLAIVLRAPVPVLAIFAGAVALLAIRELLKLSEGYGIRPLTVPTYVFIATFFLILTISALVTTTLGSAGAIPRRGSGTHGSRTTGSRPP